MTPTSRLPSSVPISLLAALAVTVLTAASAQAGAVYIPVLDAAAPSGAARTTEVLVANRGDAAAAFFGTLLIADSDGTQRSSSPASTPISAGSTLLLRSPSPPPPVGMFEIDAPDAVAVAARVRPASGAAAELPIISSRNLAAAGDLLDVMGLTRTANGVVSDLTLANLGRTAARCQITVFSTGGARIAPPAQVTLAPLSLRNYHDALAILGVSAIADARASVSCDQPFYAFASRADAGGEIAFLLPAATGASTLQRPTSSSPPPAPGSAVVFRLDGLVHQPTPGNEVRELTIPVPRSLDLRSLTVDLDIVPGPWNTRKVPGVHGLIWLYRGRFRSGTIANLSAVGAGDSSSLRMNQNVDLPAGVNRSSSAGYQFQQGTTYHLRYTYDAASNQVTLELSQGGQTLRTLRMEGTAADQVLTVPASGLIAQLGNWGTEPGPEVASYGWQYSNLRITLTPYP